MTTTGGKVKLCKDDDKRPDNCNRSYSFYCWRHRFRQHIAPITGDHFKSFVSDFRLELEAYSKQIAFEMIHKKSSHKYKTASWLKEGQKSKLVKRRDCGSLLTIRRLCYQQQSGVGTVAKHARRETRTSPSTDLPCYLGQAWKINGKISAYLTTRLAGLWWQ